MGVYASYDKSEPEHNPDGSTTWTEYQRLPGIVRSRTITATEWKDHERTDCYCCSCGDYGSDPYCRNHGFAGTRRCDVHRMPGTGKDPEYLHDGVYKVDLVKLRSVQQEARR